MPRYLVIIEKGERNYGAYAPDVPGCVATGKTAEEVQTRMQQALAFHLEGMNEDGEPLPESTSEAVYIFVLASPQKASRRQVMAAYNSNVLTTPKELWHRVQALEGTRVKTLVRGHQNDIETVDERGVLVRGRRSIIPRSQIEYGFECLRKFGEFNVRSGEAPDRWTLYVVPAILNSALGPDIVEPIPGTAGIRLKR